LADDENAIFYNPAGLTQIQNQRVVLSGFYQDYSIREYSYYSQLGLCLQYIRNGLGISATIWGRGDWTEYYQTDENGQVLRTFNTVFQERFITLSYAREIYHNLNLGISGKYIFTIDPFEQLSEEYSLLKDTQGFAIGIGI
jgi:hypothetical protein